ncbi:MAG TPA: cell division protein ZapA [Fibrobacteraceae bacterium]|nr:cell division protein ZapA [Fibrobacteraceae bacterium]
MDEAQHLQSTRIVIGGERFQVQTDLAADEMQLIIAYVESKMREHLTPSLRADPRKQLILMSMEIAAELFATKNRVAELEREREHTSSTAVQLAEQLDAELTPVPPQPSSPPTGNPTDSARSFLS